MENVILIVHLVIAVFLIAVVLLQRSEGGALGIGGGGGGGTVTARSGTTALTKVTWGLAAAFIATSLTLTILAATGSASRSVIDRVETPLEDGAAPLPSLPGADEDGTLGPELDGLLSPPPAAGPTDDGTATGSGAPAEPASPTSPPVAQ